MIKHDDIGSNVPALSIEDIQLDLDLGLKIVDLAEKAGADMAEVFMVKGLDIGFSIENDTVNFATSSIEFGLGIRLLKNKRLGFGYSTDPDKVEKAIKNAVNATKLAEEVDLEFISERKPKEIPDLFDRSLLELSVEEGLELANRLISIGKELDKRILVTGGGIGYGGGSLGVVTSLGAELSYTSTGIYAGISTLIKDKSVSTGFEYDHSKMNDIDLKEIGTTAAELAIKGQDPKQVEPGQYMVMFTPNAINELLEFTIIPSLYGEPAKKGETVYSNRIGEVVADQALSFIDDGTLPKGINTAPFDDEGVPCQKTVLIENGVLKNYLFDNLSAAEFDEVSTGNALRAEAMGGGRTYKAPPKVRSLNFTIEGPNKSRDEIISELDNAIIIHELLGAHTANPASGDFSVNSPTLFKVESGSIASAGKGVMLSGNMPELLNKIIAIGDDYKSIGGGLTPVAARVPSILIEDVRII